MTDFKIEEIENPRHPLLLKTIDLLQSRLKPGQVSNQGDFLNALRDKKKWFPDNYHLLMARDGHVIAAAAAGYYLGDINAGFINYVVVDEAYEGKGLASMLRQELIDLFCNDAKNNRFESPEGYLGEVEHNNPWLKTLIKKFGVIPLDVPYVQPPFKKKQKPIPLVLYFQPCSGNKLSADKSFVEKIVHSIYNSVYDIKHPRKKSYFRKMLEYLK